jgi:hypothetical protein
MEEGLRKDISQHSSRARRANLIPEYSVKVQSTSIDLHVNFLLKMKIAKQRHHITSQHTLQSTTPLHANQLTSLAAGLHTKPLTI